MRSRQSEFVRMIGLLIQYATQQGYELTFGDAYRDIRCSHWGPGTFHAKRLAVDFNLFKDGRYLTETEDHRSLGEFWESIGGSWGGRWDDGNHYSYGE